MAEHTTTLTGGRGPAPKIGYRLEVNARHEAARLTEVNGRPYSRYRCSVCGLWHVGRTPSPFVLHRNASHAIDRLEFTKREIGAMNGENQPTVEGRLGYLRSLFRPRPRRMGVRADRRRSHEQEWLLCMNDGKVGWVTLDNTKAAA